MEEYIVEFSYTHVREDFYTAVVRASTRQVALREAKKMFHSEQAEILEPYDHLTILHTYVEVQDRSPGYRGRGLIAALSPALQAIPD